MIQPKALEQLNQRNLVLNVVSFTVAVAAGLLLLFLLVTMNKTLESYIAWFVLFKQDTRNFKTRFFFVHALLLPGLIFSKRDTIKLVKRDPF